MWLDMTVEDADAVSQFYADVMGWRREAVEMGDYVDYVMMKPDGNPAGGICHRRGANAQLPSGWVPYFTVNNLTDALQQVAEQGGETVGDVRKFGTAEYCLIRDPAGCYCALYAENKTAA